MGAIVLLFVLPVFALGPYLISRKVYGRLQSYQSGVRILASVMTFLVSLSLILVAAGYIILTNMSFER